MPTLAAATAIAAFAVAGATLLSPAGGHLLALGSQPTVQTQPRAPAAAVPLPLGSPRRVGGGVVGGTRFRWPVRGQPVIVHDFAPGPRAWSRGHRGIDLLAAPGADVLAAGAGTVVFAGVVAGRGVVVVAHSPDLRTTYEPVTASVQLGRRVALGDRLGAVQGVGSRCQPRSCLHWGAITGGQYIDPRALLASRASLVLLPYARGIP